MVAGFDLSSERVEGGGGEGGGELFWQGRILRSLFEGGLRMGPGCRRRLDLNGFDELCRNNGFLHNSAHGLDHDGMGDDGTTGHPRRSCEIEQTRGRSGHEPPLRGSMTSHGTDRHGSLLNLDVHGVAPPLDGEDRPVNGSAHVSHANGEQVFQGVLGDGGVDLAFDQIELHPIAKAGYLQASVRVEAKPSPPFVVEAQGGVAGHELDAPTRRVEPVRVGRQFTGLNDGERLGFPQGIQGRGGGDGEHETRGYGGDGGERGEARPDGRGAAQGDRSARAVQLLEDASLDAIPVEVWQGMVGHFSGDVSQPSGVGLPAHDFSSSEDRSVRSELPGRSIT